MKGIFFFAVVFLLVALSTSEVNGCFTGYADITSCLSYNEDYYYSYEYCYEGRPATTDDAASVGLTSAYANWISANVGAQCSSPFPAVSYDDTTLQDLACVSQGSAFLTNQEQSNLQNVLVEQTFINNDNDNVTYTFELQTTFTNQQTYTVTQESSFSISDTLSFSVDDFGFNFGNSFTLSTGIENTQSTSTEYSTSQQVSETPTVDIPPGGCVKAAINGNITQLSGNIDIPSLLNGPIRCDFGSSVCGHYYWVANMKDCTSTAIIETTVGILVAYTTTLSDCSTGEVLYEKERVLVELP